MFKPIFAVAAVLFCLPCAAQKVQWENSDQCWAIWKERSALWHREYNEQARCWAQNRCRNPGADPRFDQLGKANERLANACRASRDAEQLAKRNADQQRRDQEHQQALRAEYQRRQQQQYARELERQQAQQDRQQAREPRVIGQVEPSPFHPATRNEPRVVAPPPATSYQPQRTQVQQDPQRVQQQQQQQQQADALAGAFRGLFNAMTTRPGSAGPAGAETNVAVNAGRGGSPVAGAIGGAAIGTAGARSADVMNQYDRAMNQATLPDTPPAAAGSRSSVAPVLPTARSWPSGSAGSEPAPANGSGISTAPAGSGAPAGTSPTGPATSGGNATTLAQAPTPDDRGGSSGEPRSPTQACGKRVLFAQARCLYQQCQKPEFAGHADCAKPAEPTN